MAFTTNGFSPASVEYLKVGNKYRVRIREAQVKQFIDQGTIIDKLELTLDVSGVKIPRPNSISFKSRPATNDKNAQDKWDEKWTRFKEIFGIPMDDENFAGWCGMVGELEVGDFRGAPFFQLPKKQAQPAQNLQPAVTSQPQMKNQPMQQFQQAFSQPQQNVTQAVNSDGFVEDIPF